MEGGCACGAVRYRLTQRPMFVNCCHCRHCQRETGGACAINAVIETDSIALLGETPTPVAMPTESGRPHDIHRCAKCHTAVWSDYGRRGVMRFVRVATLDDPTALPPGAHVFTATKLPWVRLDGSAPAFEIFYDMASLWPPESLARRAALLGPGR